MLESVLWREGGGLTDSTARARLVPSHSLCAFCVLLAKEQKQIKNLCTAAENSHAGVGAVVERSTDDTEELVAQKKILK